MEFFLFTVQLLEASKLFKTNGFEKPFVSAEMLGIERGEIYVSHSLEQSIGIHALDGTVIDLIRITSTKPNYSDDKHSLFAIQILQLKFIFEFIFGKDCSTNENKFAEFIFEVDKQLQFSGGNTRLWRAVIQGYKISKLVSQNNEHIGFQAQTTKSAEWRDPLIVTLR